MKLLLICIVSLFSTTPAWAYSCPPKTLEENYKTSERVFLIYVTDTKLEEAALEKIAPEQVEKEDMKILSVGYRVIEEFKGEQTYQPRLIDLLGISVGHVGFTPGVYYLVMLPFSEERAFPDMRQVDFCNMPYSHYRLKAEPFQEQLNKIRGIRDK